MPVTRVNNVYLLKSEYYADVVRLDPFQDATPCWHPDSFIYITLSYYNCD